MHFFLILTVCKAQRIDSLTKALKTADDTSKVFIFNQLAEAYSKVPSKPSKKKKNFKQPDKALEFALEALKLSEELKFKKGIAISNFSLGKDYLKKKNYRDAELAFLNSVELAKELKMHELVLKNFDYIFRFHKEIGNDNNAIAYANIKSEYKSVIIEELKNDLEKLSEAKSLVDSQNYRLDSLLKVKKLEEAETKKALARLPEIKTVVEYKTKTDFKVVGVALLLIALMGFVTFKSVQEKNKKERQLQNILGKPKDNNFKSQKLPAKKEVNPSVEDSKEQSVKPAAPLNQIFYMLQKNEILGRLKKELQTLKESKIEELPSRINLIESFVNTNLDSKKDWETFLSFFFKLHPEYLSSIKSKFPKLSELELRILALQKIRLTSYEMAALMSVKEEEIRNVITEINKKVEM